MSRFSFCGLIIKSCFFLLTSLSIAWVYAQDIEEVVVEAERQEANTLDVTESLDIFDLEDLEVYRITGLADVANNVPGLTASPSGSQGLRFTLRGIGARDSQLGVESKIGLYVDGAYLGRASGLVFDIVDLEMVEVAKGPQGFRFGRHAIGGNINLITAKAKVDEFYSRAEVTFGNYDRQTYKATVNLPVNDQFAVRASAFTNKRDGWVENTGKGVDWSGFNREGFKIAARWYPTDDLIIDYSYDQADFITQPVYYQPEFREGYDELCFSTADVGSYNVAFYGLNQAVDGDCNSSLTILSPMGQGRLDQDESTVREIENSTTEASGHSLTFQWAWSEDHQLDFISTYRTSDVNNTFFFFPNTTTDRVTLSNAITNVNNEVFSGLNGTYDSSSRWYSAYGFENLSLLGLALNENTTDSLAYAQNLFNLANSTYPGKPPWTEGFDPFALHPELAGDGFEQINFSNFFERFGAILSQGGGPGMPGSDYAIASKFNSIFASPEGGLASLDDHKQTSFELRQEGSFLDARLNYVAGLYYFNERTGNGPGNLPSGYYYADLVELLDFGELNGSPGSENDFGFSYITINRLNTKSYAWYAYFDYTPLKFDERLHLSLGMRKSIDKRTLSRQKLQAITLQPRGMLDEEEETWSSFDPMFKVAYDMTPDFTGYASVTSGYRPGNFNVDSRQLPDKANNGLGDNQNVDTSTGASIAFDTESLIAYEVGGKGSLLNGLLDIEFATYYYNVKGGQETVIFPTSPVSRAVVNADGYAFGAEFDSTWHLTDNLTALINYAQLRSGSESYSTPFVTDYGRSLNFTDDATEAQALVRECVGGLRVPDFKNGRCQERKSNFGAPINSWQLGLDYSLPVTYGELFFHLGYSFKEAHYVNDTLKVDDRNLWDVRISASFEQDWGTLKVAAWGQNIFDNEYQVQKFELYTTVLDVASYGDPRMFGIDVIAEWY